MEAATETRQASETMAKDPICGMVINKSTALTLERNGRTYYFCSPNCLKTFESPEQELKAMRTRVSIALTESFCWRSGALPPSLRWPRGPPS
jgi:YHS domain-containing protein